MHQIVRPINRESNSPSVFFAPAASGANSPTVIEQPDRLSSSCADAASERSPSLMRARATDPLTSHADARKAARFAASHAGRILAALQVGPATAHELTHRTGLSVVQIDRRMTELADAGRVCLVLFMGEPLVRGGARVWEAY